MNILLKDFSPGLFSLQQQPTFDLLGPEAETQGREEQGGTTFITKLWLQGAAMQPRRISQAKPPPMARVPGTGTTPALSCSSFTTHFARITVFSLRSIWSVMCVFYCSSSEANPLSVWFQERLEGPASSSLPLMRSDSVISQASGNSWTQHNKRRSVTLKEQRKGPVPHSSQQKADKPVNDFYAQVDSAHQRLLLFSPCQVWLIGIWMRTNSITRFQTASTVVLTSFCKRHLWILWVLLKQPRCLPEAWAASWKKRLHLFQCFWMLSCLPTLSLAESDPGAAAVPQRNLSQQTKNRLEAHRRRKLCDSWLFVPSSVSHDSSLITSAFCWASLTHRVLLLHLRCWPWIHQVTSGSPTTPRASLPPPILAAPPSTSAPECTPPWARTAWSSTVPTPEIPTVSPTPPASLLQDPLRHKARGDFTTRPSRVPGQPASNTEPAPPWQARKRAATHTPAPWSPVQALRLLRGLQPARRWRRPRPQRTLLSCLCEYHSVCSC